MGLKNADPCAAIRGSIVFQRRRSVVHWLYRVLWQDGNPPLDPSEHFMAEEEKLTDQERSKRWACSSYLDDYWFLHVWRCIWGRGESKETVVFSRFEKAYTHTLYYLAQVYQHLEMIEKAAQYCHTTLKRQLEYCGYYPVEWALNAATLSQYYLSKVTHLMFFCCNCITNVAVKTDNCLNNRCLRQGSMSNWKRGAENPRVVFWHGTVRFPQEDTVAFPCAVMAMGNGQGCRRKTSVVCKCQ